MGTQKNHLNEMVLLHPNHPLKFMEKKIISFLGAKTTLLRCFFFMPGKNKSYLIFLGALNCCKQPKMINKFSYPYSHIYIIYMVYQDKEYTTCAQSYFCEVLAVTDNCYT